MGREMWNMFESRSSRLKKLYNLDKIDINDENICKYVVKILNGFSKCEDKGYIENFKELVKYIELIGLDFDNFSILYNGVMYELVYYYNGLVFRVDPAVSVDLGLESLKERCDRFKDCCINDKSWGYIFWTVHQSYVITCFNVFAGDMSKDDVRDIGRGLYINLDYGASNIWEQHLNIVFEESRVKFLEDIQSEYITIYRGIGSKSKKINEDFYSWTLDEDVAKFFATRFCMWEHDEKAMKVYKLKIKADEILGYIGGSEKEILISPEIIDKYIDDIKEIEFNKTEIFIKNRI